MIIYVTDANDHDPEFSQEVYTATLSELIPVGSFVVSLSATDLDTGLNAEIQYTITDGNELGWFDIDENTGLVTTTAVLDRELVSDITLNITANDQGRIQHHAKTHLVITILDENDQTPLFTFTSYNITIPENAEPQREITIVSASDSDLGVNGTIFYRLEDHVSVDYPGTFSIDTTSGKIITLISFDREQISHYTVTVKAFDGGNPALSSTTQVNVRIMDVNDNYPEFYPINYYSDIQENKPVGTSVAKVNASDPDFGNNGKISYSIIQGNTNGKFAIDRTSGLVTTTVSLDREEVQSYELRVRAVDEGSPAKTSQIDARIHVSVADILDTPPTFGKPIYNFKIYENVDIGHEVGTVHASTRDPSSVITYAISSGDRSGVFQIDSVSGEILTAQNIDREEKSSYQLTVIANGGPVIGETVVNIEVLDLNDNAPQFPRDAVTINIVENWNVGHNVYKVVATDRDQGPNAEIVYQLIKNPGNLFSIDSSSGQITVGTSISDQTSTYFLQVSATDIGTPHRSSVLNITVQILDVNDHSPVFIQNEYVTEIVESVDLNTQFFQVTATDTDIGENGRITYSITSGNNDNRFGIFPDGSLYVKNALDRELVEVYTLTISAFDNGVPQRSSSAQVVVNVQDANDNRPLFTNQTYYFYLQEELPSSSYVGKIIASDQDQGTNSELRFSLSTVQSDFTINALNGEVSSTRTFDREELIRNGISTMFELNAVVHDNGNIQLEDEAVIYIYITDINDNSPQFVSSLYTASISETAMINTPVVHAVAYDDDSGTNAEITYTITSGNDDNKFHISAVTGQITLNGAIDREIITEYTLTVNAEDKGIPDVRSTSTQIIITVLDENDNAPVFAQSARSVDVAESSQIGEFITTVSASDEDLGQNALITYTISAGNLLETFHIDQDSGNLYLAKSLDYESKNYYELSITARDNGKSPLTDTIGFEIHVRDTNDNEPVFRSNAIVHQVTEGIGFGTKLVTVTATDTDSGVNGQLAYSIANQSPPGEHFTIDSASGEIFTAADIDREYLPNGVFEITVMATDQAIPVTSRKSATKIVTIIVKDVNDNAPVFISQNSATISESTNPGGVVTMVTAVDPDAERNGEVIYSLSTDYNGLFVISTSGIITVSRRLNSPPRTYTLTVTATDNGKTPKSSSFQLTVIVTSASSTGAPFTKFRYTASVFENEPIGRNVIAVSASYPGNTQAQIEYYITAIKTGNFEHGRKFIIDKDSGAITVGNELDREAGYTDFTVDVYAVDLGASTPQTTRTQVQITLLDRNDNAPQFEESTRNVEVPEDISINSLVATVSAQDPDEGSNALVSYSIVSGDDGKFYINEESGEVRTRSRLDRETIASYNLDVSASDGSQYSVMSLGVKLLDSNDSPPEFSKEVYSFTVFEDEDVGVSVAEVMATDPDEGTNGEVTYSILEDWGQNRFELDADTGVFTLVQPLDFEKVQYYLITVEATDHGSPPMSSNVKCYFNTLDINDNPPIFDPSEYDEITVYEDVAIGTIAITVTATDADSGPNGAILYEIVSGDDNGDFDILENGTIITAKELDREEKSFYSLKITATDQPLDESLQMQDEVQINIKIGDVNDNAPEFINDNVTEVSEDAESGVVVITVEAEDPDEGVNGLVEYSMDPVPGNVFFMNGGDIVVSGNLDRETVAQYILTVYAEDGGDPSLTSTMEVLVNILDINDNAPEFDPSSYTDNIMENTPPGKEFLQVSATDPDEGLNGTVEFSIINGNYDNDFDIDEDSGVISIVNVIDRERRSQYSLTVMAKDKGIPSQSSSTTVTINLIDVNDNIPEFTEEFMTGSIDENNANTPVFVRTCDAEDEDEGSYKRS
ncbi:protocadherin Fat 4-like [Glandiceps talaboti]